MDISESIRECIKGVSYVGDPKPDTAMFISKKVDYLLKNLYNTRGCLVFIENTVEIPDDLQSMHMFILTDHPQANYAEFVTQLANKINNANRKRTYKLTDRGYYVGENVKIGVNAYIEPGCVIGHDVIIGDNASVLANSVIKNAIIGDGFNAAECVVVGSEGFALTKDSEENWMHIPTLGKVRMGNNVDLGTHDNICRGTAGDTLLDDYVKLDAFVHVGHDAHLKSNTEITAGGVIGGYVITEPKTSIGINATIRNRIVLGSECMIGMGAVVTKSVVEKTTVVGNPAKPLEKE